MAISIKGFCRLNISWTKNILFKSNFISVGIRNLYTENDLGITGYESTRFVLRNQFLTIEDTFRSKMKDMCEDENAIVYTEDLKAMLHLVRQDDSDLKLLNQMLEKYVKSKDERKFSSYVFGPVAMRAYYYLDQPKYAIEAYENPILTESFHYRSAFRIIMCLLYKHKMMQELRDIYDKYLSAKGQEFIGTHSVLMHAACLVEGTPEAFQFAFNHWKESFNMNRPSVRSSGLLALLAINVNEPEVATEIVSTIERDRITSVRSIKLLAYMRLEKYLQIIPILKRSVEQGAIGGRKLYFFGDVLYDLEEKMNTTNVPEKDEVLNLIDQTKQLGLLETRNTLQEFLLRPITIHPGEQGGRDMETRNKRYFRIRNQQSDFNLKTEAAEN